MLSKAAVIALETSAIAKPGTVASAMAILRLLADSEHPLGVNAIARELSLAPSSCFKILKTLLADDFVEIDARKCYSLGIGAITVARRALDPARAYTIVRPRLEAVAETYSIAIGLWRVLSSRRMVLIGFAEGTNQMRIHMSIGSRLPILMGAVGRAIAARLNFSEDQLREQFDALRWSSPISFTEYATQVDLAKQRGYGLDEGHYAPGVTTAAVAISDEIGEIRYGLSGIMFSGQHDGTTIEKIADELTEVAGWCSLRLVGKPLG